MISNFVIFKGMKSGDSLTIYLMQDPDGNRVWSHQPKVLRPGAPTIQLGPFGLPLLRPSKSGTLRPLVQIVEAWNQGLALSGLKLGFPCAFQIHNRTQHLRHIECYFDPKITPEGSLAYQLKIWNSLELTLVKIA